MSSTSATRADQYASPSWSPAWRARRAFSPREAWKIARLLGNDRGRSEDKGPWRAWRGGSGGGALGARPFAKEKVVGLTLNPPTLPEPEGLRAGAPPAARRLAAALAGLEVVAGRVLRRAAVHVRPDVVQVIAFAQGRDNCH